MSRLASQKSAEVSAFGREVSSATTRHKFEIVETDLSPPPTHCPVLGVELEWGGKKNDPYLPSLDRTVPELEYVKGNVVIMSARANTLKNDGTVAEFEALLAYMRANPTHGG